MKNRYRLILGLMLPALLAGGSAMAQAQGVKVYGSVYGGGNLAVVNGSTTVNVGGGTIGTAGQGGATYGNVYGGGKGKTQGDISEVVQSGLVKGNTNVTIYNGTILHNIYGGGAYGSVGTYTYADGTGSVTVGTITGYTSGGTANVNILGGTIGVNGKENGIVFGSSRGDVDAPGNIQDKLAWVYDTHVTIGTSGQGTAAPQPQIKGSVYGGGENGHTYHNAEVIVHSGTIGIAEGTPITTNDNGTPDDPSDDTTLSGAAYPYRGNVYGAGCGTDKYYSDPDNETYDGNGQLYNRLAGIVQGNTTVTIDGGHVVHNVYGAGAMGSVGTVTNQLEHKGTQNSVVYTDGTGVDEKIYGFGLSWPVEFTYAANTGSTTISITDNAEIGVDGTASCGHVFGAARGAVEVGEDDITNQRYVEAYLANVRTASITIGTTSGTQQPTIHGSVYGGGEDGHVYENATVTINGGAIAHSVFGGGKGEGTYTTTLWDSSTPGVDKTTGSESIYSWTAGKVYGNTTVTMNGGSVGYNIYGGGNLASVGKGSYSGGIDDYSTTGYGEQPRKDGTAEGPLWTANPTEGTDAWHFANSGISTVNIYGGIVGTNTGSDGDGMPYGNVFGGSRGKAASSGRLSPRYRYMPDFFLGYVNKAIVNIGNDSEGAGPTINASVYGGGQDGHIRNSAQVTIKKGTIGIANDTNVDRGNVFGAGSGIGKYDANNDGTEDACNYSSGSVTCTTQIDIEGGTIYRNVYGGGALSSVGPPNTGQKINNIAYDEIKELNANTGTHKSVSYTKVNIKGGAISGSVYGASRGPSDAIMAAAFGGSDANHTYDSKKFATVIWSDVNVTGAAAISGSVYGGGEKGIVKHATNVNIGIPAVGETAAVPYTGTIAENVFGGGKEAAVGGNITVNLNTGTINKDVYGGGALANTNTNTDNGATTGAKVTDNTDALAISGETNAPTTTVNLLGGKINGDAYGGGLGQLAKAAVAGEHYTQEEINAATEGDPAYGKTTNDWKVEPASAVTAIPATVAGDIFVNLGDTATASATSFDISYLKDNNNNDVVNSGRVFGCNNLNGSPKGDVTVTVWKTVAGTGASGKTDPSKINSETESDHIYQLAAVYGGGNLAPFTETGKKANVIIHGCGETSILTVYGGGNAAPVPNTNVAIYGTYEIGAAFGGGNGKDKYTLDGGTTWNTNPGADVGESGNTTDGKATTMIYGGTVHEAYGGSNKKGTIYGTVTIDVGSASQNIENCTLNVGKIVGAGKNADIEGDLKIIMGCKPNDVIPLVFGGADDANVNGDVELTITSGHFGKVFGGNNMGGIIKGHIKLNIEETGKCAIPITIDELYLGGNQAMYSMWGYYEEGDEYKPRTGPNDSHTAEAGIHTPNATDGYGAPELNIISCTSIGQVFGGGLGTRASMYANPIVNINMLPGDSYGAIDRDNNGTADNKTHALGEIGDVFGGGNQATVYGNTTVNIGTATTVLMTSLKVADLSSAQEFAVGTDNYNRYQSVGDDVYGTVQGAYISGDVYGGGNLANVTGNTFVNICANKTDDTSTADIVEYTSKTYDGTDFEGVVIKGSVYGGGKGLDDTFLCEKAMIGEDGAGVDADYNDITTYLDGNTHVIIGNGTVEGSVYGGGMIGRVEKNTTVTIGTELTETGKTSAPDIKGNVFGGGKGKETHGYAALVRGNPTVTVQADAKVGLSVYGAGEIASVARYKVPKTEEQVNQAHAAGYTEAQLGMPYALANTTTRRSGYCTVTVKGNAEIGPDGMKMVHPEITDGSDKPDDTGYVFAAGKGFLPTVYTYSDTINKPKRMVLYDESVHTAGTQGTDWEYYDKADPEHNNKNVWEYFKNETDYIKFIQTQALASYTEVTIDGNAFVKGAVYGGSENGLVQFDTKVYIKGGQIGCGKNTTARHPDEVWADNYTPSESNNLECESWDYGKVEGTAPNQTTVYASYDPNANATGDLEKYPKVASQSEAKSTRGGRRIATDGHTYYGNVFGGGSGSVPYFDTNAGISKYLNTAGTVKGNTYVEITGGHILTNVYGGCEATNVLGNSKVVMTGGTLGVPRTENQIKNHPVTCYLFGAGKGDQRIYFNKDTNVENAEVEVDGGRIYGSVFGGAEDGHVLGNTKVTIKQSSGRTTKIGNYGTTYVDGNIFGGGRGFAGDAYTAGNVSGSVEVDIQGGTMLGSVYGGGRLASVGYGLYLVNESGYGLLREDNTQDDGSTTTDFTKGRGHVTINISGGTIGNDYEYIMPTSTNIPTGLSSDISTWSEPDWTEWKTHNHVPLTEYDADGKLLHTKGGNVFAGGMGRREDLNGKPIVYNANDPTSINWHKLGNVKQTKVTISGTAWIKSNVYGGGELGAVRSYYEGSLSNPTLKQGGTTEVTITGGTIGTLMGPSVAAGGTKDLTELSSMTYENHDKCYTFGNVFGGGSGTEKDITELNKYTRDMEIYAALVIDSTKVSMTGGRVLGSVYGGGEVACVGGNTKVEVKGDSKIGVNEVRKDTYKTNYVLFGSWRMGNVYGGGRGSEKAFMAGLVMGNATVDISGSAGIYHNVYGGGAIGSVGLFNLAADDWSTDAYVLGGTPVTRLNGGKAKVTITGTPTIGINGWDNGMVNGSSRGDVTTPVVPTGAPSGFTKKFDIYDRLGWVNETEVIIGTANDVTAGPTINGSVYGGGENGHNLSDSHVTINSGIIGYTGYNSATDTYECGNVYGAGCGTDTYDYDSDNDGTDETYYNFLAGIVRGNAYVTINGGTVRHNVYGAGSMASVGQTNASGAITGNGATTFVMTGGTVGVDGNKNGSIFGGSRGSETSTQKPLSQVKSTSVSISGSNTIVKGNVYGGGESGDVGTYTYNSTTKDYTWDQVSSTQTGDCTVSITGGTIGTAGNTATGHVFGGGKGVANTFQCDKAMARTTSVSVSGSTTKVKGNVYGGGEVGRVDQNTVVTIGNGDNEGAGTASGTDVEISGNVFGAGAGKETHGYSALVRGNATVTVQGNAQVGKNVYGGGEIAAVGRYGLDGNNMPETLQAGGDCRVTVKGYSVIGSSNEGHVFGAGKGVNPFDTDHSYIDYTSSTDKTTKPKRMTIKPNDVTGLLYDDIAGTNFIWEYYTSKEDYFNFLQTLALATDAYVTVEGNASVNGSVYGGSESGFVQRETDVKIQGSSKILTITDTNNNPIEGNVFGGGKGLSGFDKAGRVRGNATTTISGSSTVNGNVYGGGALGLVGKYVKGTDENNRTIYTWPTIKDQNNQDQTTGLCAVNINSATAEVKGNVFGGGKGEAETFECEPAMSRATVVDISAGTVSGTVYGGGEVGRVDQNTSVTIGNGDNAGAGSATGETTPVIGQDVFGAGMGLETHGYSALVRGNTTVTVQGNAKVVKNVYGGGKIASVGRYGLDVKQFPSILVGGGECTVTVKGYAKIGDSEGHVFGAGRGVTPHYYTNGVTSYSNNADKPKRMLTYSAAAVQGKTQNVDWAYYEPDHTYIWDYLNSAAEYDNYLQTLALATKPMVTIEGNASVNGDVYGGGERGITKGCVSVTIQGNASIAHDVYGGGALADTQVANWSATDNQWAWTTTSDHEHKTTVNLHGGTIGHNVFGGGLGQKAKAASGTEPAVEAIPAYVYGDVLVELNKTTATDNCVVKGEIYGANNYNGSPQRDVTVHIYKTQGWTDDKGTPDTSDDVDHDVTTEKNDNTIAKPGIYELKTVYGGGNEASYVPIEINSETHKTNVIIEGCELTSIETVYGGGDAASAPATFVNVKSCYEIGTVFAGGNGKDALEDGSLNFGAHVGYKPAEFTQDPSASDEANYAAYQTAFDAQKSSLAYGTGEAVAKLEGGTIHTAFGGSNTRGNVRVSGLVDLNEPTTGNICPLCIEEVYGAGNEAAQDGSSNINMGCISYLKEIYGGAKNADVNDNVELTIQSGRFERVFGGNNLGGCIRGSITVNIEETGCHPIVIGQLYGGGNLAGYSVRGYKQVTENEQLVWKPCEPTDDLETGMTAAFANPQVNVKSFTSIGEIFGGGYGAPAVMVGSPTVNINEVVGSSGSSDEALYFDGSGNFKGWTLTLGGKQVTVPTHDAGKIGAIGRVFGGGNAANILGNTNVKVGTDEYVFIQMSNLKAGEDSVDNFYTRNTDGTYSQASGTAATGTTYYSRHAVLGVDIRGNVFGGGNQAEVHGNTNVTIGQ